MNMKLTENESTILHETLGWCTAYYCAALDRGEDPRLEEIPGIRDKAVKDLGYEL